MFADDKFKLISPTGELMPAAIVCGEYRFGKSKHDGVKDLAAFATGVIKRGKSGRFVTPSGRNTIKIGGQAAVGYELDPTIAGAIGVPPRG
jgi:hypothetical protein